MLPVGWGIPAVNGLPEYRQQSPPILVVEILHHRFLLHPRIMHVPDAPLPRGPLGDLDEE
jgi:hypothetical protein